MDEGGGAMVRARPGGSDKAIGLHRTESILDQCLAFEGDNDRVERELDTQEPQEA